MAVEPLEKTKRFEMRQGSANDRTYIFLFNAFLCQLIKLGFMHILIYLDNNLVFYIDFFC